MNSAIAYFLGLFTALLIIILAYIFALTFTSFRSIYTNVVCTFPEGNRNDNNS